MRVIDENLFFFSWFGIDDHLMFHGFYWICFSELSMCVCGFCFKILLVYFDGVLFVDLVII